MYREDWGWGGGVKKGESRYVGKLTPQPQNDKNSNRITLYRNMQVNNRRNRIEFKGIAFGEQSQDRRR